MATTLKQYFPMLKEPEGVPCISGQIQTSIETGI